MPTYIVGPPPLSPGINIHLSFHPHFDACVTLVRLVRRTIPAPPRPAVNSPSPPKLEQHQRKPRQVHMMQQPTDLDSPAPPVDRPSIGSQSQNPPAVHQHDCQTTVITSEGQHPSITGEAIAIHTIGAASPHPTLSRAPDDRTITGSPAAAAAAHDSATVAAPASAPVVAPLASPTEPTRRHSVSSPKMLFSDLYRSTKMPLSRLRLHSHSVPACPEHDADLVSRDKIKQKEAVKRFLSARIRNDWDFKWPPSTEAVNLPNEGSNLTPSSTESPYKLVQDPSSAAIESPSDDVVEDQSDDDDNDDAVSTYSTVSEDLDHFCPRAEWLSDLSDDDEPAMPSAYRFENPDSVGSTVKAVELARSAKRRRAIRAEMEWNPGLACFNARRDAWTSAKVARVRPKSPSPAATSPTSRRLSFWRLSNPASPLSPTESAGTTQLSPTATRTSGDTTAVSSSDNESKGHRAKQDSSTYPVEILLPKPPPLLPPANPMRASITPATYPAIYDKIVVSSMTPACPVNLSDIARACVTGWKRDGEWPPRPTEPPPVVAVRNKRKNSTSHNRANAGRRMSFNFLGRRQSAAGDPSAGMGNVSQFNKDEDANMGGKGMRKSIQRVLGLGHERTGSNMSAHSAVAG
ncbi:hypothetical protein F5X99DRAFT_402273 [Biscogniauxia marginata]|nr:hypothetical protein F5X99DRAFT_402273 [Biscogniauxia marginata]